MTMRTEPLRVALAQMNATVGDIDGNAARVRELIGRGARRRRAARPVPRARADRLPARGPAAEDPLRRRRRRRAARARRVDDGASSRWSASPSAPTTSTTRWRCSPTARSQAIYRKKFLPNYGVFDEHRYFQAGTEPALVELNGIGIGLTVCEDIWEPGPPATTVALSGAQVIANISASPYHAGKPFEREQMLIQRARDNACAVLFCNLIGGQDELVFDGCSVGRSTRTAR